MVGTGSAYLPEYKYSPQHFRTLLPIYWMAGTCGAWRPLLEIGLSRARFVLHALGTCIRSRYYIIRLWSLVFPAVSRIRLVCASHVGYYIGRPSLQRNTEDSKFVPRPRIISTTSYTASLVLASEW